MLVETVLDVEIYTSLVPHTSLTGGLLHLDLALRRQAVCKLSLLMIKGKYFSVVFGKSRFQRNWVSYCMRRIPKILWFWMASIFKRDLLSVEMIRWISKFSRSDMGYVPKYVASSSNVTLDFKNPIILNFTLEMNIFYRAKERHAVARFLSRLKTSFLCEKTM